MSLKWGILATGGIAHQFAGGLKASKTGELVAVGSRAEDTARAFTDKHGGNPYASYEGVLQDPEVEAIYIATPHHLHYEWTIRCAEAGKAILCEKPFTLNALEAKRALNEVRRHKVFFMEAFMYRCTEQTQKAKELIAGGAIGELLTINTEFAFAAGKGWENFRTDGALGGGGLMDVGVYPVSLCRLLAGAEPSVAHYAAKLSGKGGYDEHGSGCLMFTNGVTAHFGCGVHCNMRNQLWAYGSEGMLHIENPWKVTKGSKMTLLASGKEPEVFDFGLTNDELYAAEADAVAQFIDAKECPYMTIEDTLGNMRTLDALRDSAGLKFSAEMLA
jgi:predicted dehydrogenase